jgi:hypothetical protein
MPSLSASHSPIGHMEFASTERAASRIHCYGISTSALPQTAEVDADDCKVRFGQKRTFPPGPQASSGLGRRGGSDAGNAEHLSRSKQGTAIFRRTCLSSDTESQSRLKVDEQKRTISGTQERDWKTLDTYFGWPVTGSTDIRVV